MELTENQILIGDFNLKLDNVGLQNFARCFDLQGLIKEPTCFKGEPSCMNLILANNKSYFKYSKTFVTGTSDFHKLIATATETNFV